MQSPLTDKRKGLSIFQRLFISHITLGFFIFVIFGFLYYTDQKQNIKTELNSAFSYALKNAVIYFDTLYTKKIQEDLGFIVFTQSPADDLFLHFTENPKGIYLSARFIDAQGNEKVITQANRRISNYAALSNLPGGLRPYGPIGPEGVFYSHLNILFERLKSAQTDAILFEGPFKYKDKMTFLVGRSKSDSQVGGFAGAVIFHCDLTDYFYYLDNQLLGKEHITQVLTSDNKPIFDSTNKNILTENPHNPYFDSQTICIGPGNQCFFKVKFLVSSHVFDARLHEIFKYSLLWILLSILPICLAAFFVSRYFSRPLIDLVSYVNHLAKGDLLNRPDIKATGEVGVLVESFNNLVEELFKTTVSRDELIKEVEKRTMAEKELARSNEELEQFAYVASHDLQEPLRMVASFCQKLETRYKDKLDEDAKEYIYYAVDGAKRMQGLVDALLIYARVGKKEALTEAVDLNKTLATIAKDLDVVIKEKRATIKVGPLPVIMANEIQMHQLFQNFLTNALKFKGDRDPVIEISARKENNGWEFKISDNGIGIDEQYFSKIFVIFQRLHDRGTYPGTGIGLALCKKIVENFNGKIRVTSKLGQGTTFYFILNVKEA